MAAKKDYIAPPPRTTPRRYPSAAPAPNVTPTACPFCREFVVPLQTAQGMQCPLCANTGRVGAAATPTAYESGPARSSPYAASPVPSPYQAYAPPAPNAGAYAARPMARPTFSKFAALGVAVLVLSIAGIIIDETAPWLYNSDVPEGADDTVDKDDMSGSGNPDYFDSMIDWPLYAFIGGIIVGAGLLVTDLAPMPRPARRATQVGLLGGAAFVGLATAVSGLRWAGLLMSMNINEDLTGNPFDGVYLHVAPWYHIAVGLALLVGSLVLVSSAMRELPGGASPLGLKTRPATYPLIAFIVCALFLLVNPFLPIATASKGDKDAYFTESFLDILSGAGGLAGSEQEVEDLKDGADALGLARTMMWILVWISLATLPLLALANVGRAGVALVGVGQLFLGGVILWGISVIMTILGYVNLFGIEDVGPSFNFLLPVAQAVLLVLYVLFLVRVTTPLLRHVSAASRASEQASQGGYYQPGPPPGGYTAPPPYPPRY